MKLRRASVTLALAGSLGAPLVVLADAAAPKVPAGGAPSASAAPSGSAVAKPAAAGAKAPKKGALPDLLGVPAPVRLVVVAPSAGGAWTVRVDNEGDKAVRIPADVRLLSFDVERQVEKAPLKKGGEPTYKVERTTCRLPDAMRPGDFPEPRALVLKPGESWIERFDPRLFCFGKDEAFLAGGSLVRPRFGFGGAKGPAWEGFVDAKKAAAAKPPKAPAPKPKKVEKAPKAPYAVESLEAPWAFDPAVELVGSTLLLSHGAPAEGELPVRLEGIEGTRPLLKIATAPKVDRPKVHVSHGSVFNYDDNRPPRVVHTNANQKKKDEPKLAAKLEPEKDAPVDQNAPHFALEVTKSASVSEPRGVRLHVTAKLESGRDSHALFRARDLSFVVAGPEKTVTCAEEAGEHAVLRDAFRKYKKGDSASFDVLLIERCPADAFSRPGLYRVTTVLHAGASGAGVGLKAFVGDLAGDKVTLVRVERSKDPFYAAAPVARRLPIALSSNEDLEGGEASPAAPLQPAK